MRARSRSSIRRGPGTPGAEHERAGRRRGKIRAPGAAASRDQPQRRPPSTRAAAGCTFDVLMEKPGRLPGQLVGRSPYLQPVQVMAPSHLIGEMVPRDDHGTLAPTACSACSRTAPRIGPESARRCKRSEPEALRNLPTDNGIVPAASEANDTATTQTVLTFDDNRRASTLFGQYGQNLALIERRLGVVADSRGNQVTHRGLARRPASTRAACSKVSMSSSSAATIFRRATSKARSASRSRKARCSTSIRRPRAPRSRRSICASARCAPAPPARTPICARSSATSSCSAPARPAPARPGSRSRMRSRCSSARKSTASSCRGRRSRPASGSAFCPATCARRSIPICGRSTTRCST